MAQQILIKNMVCPSCVKVISAELKQLGLEVVSIQLGKAVVNKNKGVTKQAIVAALKKNGFELIENPEEELIEQTKIFIAEWVQELSAGTNPPVYTAFLAKKTGRSYTLLSRLFSKYLRTTVEHYIILQKIERAKELIEYGEHTFSEIAYHLHYKNPQHLANQFKSISGFSMSEYKKLGSR